MDKLIYRLLEKLKVHAIPADKIAKDYNNKVDLTGIGFVPIESVVWEANNILEMERCKDIKINKAACEKIKSMAAKRNNDQFYIMVLEILEEIGE